MNPNEILNGYRNLRKSGVSAQDAERWLQSKGSNLDEVAAFAQYGPENVMRARDTGDAKRAEIESNRPFSERATRGVSEFFGENPVGRGISSALQGLNKGNPLVQATSLIPGLDAVNDNIIEPENELERAIDLGTQFATPAGVTAKGIGTIGKLPKVAKALSKTRAGRFVAGALRPSSMPIEYATAGGAGALTGAIDPESTIGKIGTGLIGGLGGASIIGLGKSIAGALRNTAPRVARESIAPETRRALNLLEQNVGGRENLEQMLSNGRPLLEQNSTVVNDLARAARDRSPQAAEKLTERISQNQIELPTMIRNTIDDVFGSTNTIKNAEELAKRLDPLATTQYEAAFTNIQRNPMTGGTRQTNARLPMSRYEQLNKNPYIRDAISTAPNVHKELQVAGRRAIKDQAGNITGYEQISAPRNEMRRLDFAKEILDNQIARERAAPAPNTRLIASLTNAKNQLVGAMDKYSPQYAKARATSGQKLSALEAQELGKKWNWADNSVAKFQNTVDGMTDEQLRSFRLGLRDSIENKMGETPTAFAAQLLRKNTQEKLKIALGDESAKKLTDMATRIRGELNTRNRVIGGSMTSTNLGNSADDAIGAVEQFSTPKGAIRGTARMIDNRRTRSTMNALADLLLADPASIQLPQTSTPIKSGISNTATTIGNSLPRTTMPLTLYNVLRNEQ